MPQISLTRMTFEYTGHYTPVFDNVSLELSTDWKLGLVGRNGRGKTTLLKLIKGELQPTSGEIRNPVPAELFPYRWDPTHPLTRDVMKNSIAGLATLEARMEQLLEENTAQALEAYGLLLAEFMDRDGYGVESRIEKELQLMGLPQSLLDRAFDTLSGGEQTKILIICLFMRKNKFILMDEPTNHLDIGGKASLARYLSKKSGFIVVSHDREFLDQTVDHILSIVKSDILLEKGNFSSWHHNRMLEDAYELRTHENLTREIGVLEKSARESRRFSFVKEGQKKGAYDKGAVGAQAARLMKRAQNTERRKQRMVDEKKALLKNHEKVHPLEITQEKAAATVMQVNGLFFSFGHQPLLSDISFTVSPGDRFWIRGGNGTGKSTLLNLIRGNLRPDQGLIRFMPGIRIAESFQEALWQRGFLNQLLQETSVNGPVFRTILAHFNMQGEYFERPLETFSQGELKKIDIARALAQENHLLIMDEPLNYMDIDFRQQLEKALGHYKPTLIFVEHDTYFGEAVSTHILDVC